MSCVTSKKLPRFFPSWHTKKKKALHPGMHRYRRVQSVNNGLIVEDVLWGLWYLVFCYLELTAYHLCWRVTSSTSILLRDWRRYFQVLNKKLKLRNWEWMLVTLFSRDINHINQCRVIIFKQNWYSFHLGTEICGLYVHAVVLKPCLVFVYFLQRKILNTDWKKNYFLAENKPLYHKGMNFLLNKKIQFFLIELHRNHV